MYTYSITRENGHLYLSCLTGGIGTGGKHLVGLPDGRAVHALDLFDTLVDRQHTSGDPELLVYEDKPVQLEIKHFRKFVGSSSDFKPDCLAVVFKCQRDPLTLSGFCKVLTSKGFNPNARRKVFAA